LKKSRKGSWTRESTPNSPNIWLLRNISVAADPENVAIPLFAQLFARAIERCLKTIFTFRKKILYDNASFFEYACHLFYTGKKVYNILGQYRVAIAQPFHKRRVLLTFFSQHNGN
jgi:hypothetical protein